MKYHAFISYAREDLEIAEMVYATLSSSGFRCWMDLPALKSGQDWLDEVLEALEESEIVIIIYSRYTNTSGWVEDEIRYAREHHKPMLPIFTEDIDPPRKIWIYFSKFHRFEAFPPPIERHLPRLVEHLEALIAGEEEQSSGGADENGLEEDGGYPPEPAGELGSPADAGAGFLPDEPSFEAPYSTGEPPVEAPYILTFERPGSGTRLPFLLENPDDRLLYAWIPAGEFEMGFVDGDRDVLPPERPRHAVRITRAFWISQTPITVRAYLRFRPTTPSPKWLHPGHPMPCVTWLEAREYCEKAGGRLPTEAEWEYAARGGIGGQIFPWDGNPEAAPKISGKLARAGQNIPNGYGLTDLTGHVWQWCADSFDADYYSRSPMDDPVGPGRGRMRVLRGGSFASPPVTHRLSSRAGRPPHAHEQDIGFRCLFEEGQFPGI